MPKKAKAKSGAPLGILLQKNQKILRVLHKHGIHFCPGCYLTLFATPKKAAAYHAVPDVDKFLKDLKRTTGK